MVCVKWRLERSQLIQDDACRPNVTLIGVALSHEDLGGDVVRRSPYSAGTSVTKDFRYSKVPYLYDASLCQENILALNVSVQNFPIVTMLQRKAYLREHLQDVLLLEPHSLVVRQLGIFLLGLSSHMRGHVAVVAVFHNDAQFAFLGLECLPKAHDVGVVEKLQNFCFLLSFTALALTHVLDVNLLNHSERAI